MTIEPPAFRHFAASSPEFLSFFNSSSARRALQTPKQRSRAQRILPTPHSGGRGRLAAPRSERSPPEPWREQPRRSLVGGPSRMVDQARGQRNRRSPAARGFSSFPPCNASSDFSTVGYADGLRAGPLFICRSTGACCNRPGEAEMTDWSNALAPTLEDIERLAEAAYARLPEAFRKLCTELVIQVVDFPDDQTLDDMGAQTEFDLLGLFRGRGLAQRGAVDETGELPNMIWLYRRPLLDFWCEGEDSLGAVVTHVLVHEIGHHFGLSDEDMEAIEREAAD